MSESMYLGQVNRSTDITINGRVKKIKNDLTLTIKSVFIKITIEKKTSAKLNSKNPKDWKMLNNTNTFNKID